MGRTGFAELPLHSGKAPQWLVKRMIKLAREISTIIIDEYGREVFLQRLSDPYWFQAFGCVLGYDWHSSGVTTVVTGVLKSALNPEEHGVAVCGGKGKASMRTQEEIVEVGEKFNLSTGTIERLKYSSRLSAKVDNVAIQAGYPLYHHAFFMTEDGKWAVIQQGMSLRDRTARRYHWLSDAVRSFVVEPHNAIVGDAKREIALDMTARESGGCRERSVEVAKEDPRRVARMLKSIRPSYQRSLKEWIKCSSLHDAGGYVAEFLSMPLTVNWKALKKVYEFQPRDYEELLGIRGVGPATVRGLALISEIIYGEKPSWRDPVKYSFAFGGKDGVPFPVDRRSMDESIRILRDAIEQARIGDRERLRSLKRLRRLIPEGEF
ncbi:DUF763 domain-containing protein [Candidatus Bathyarchaeota archaeon]|nr:MAG: DUF763 domain-containing protein [Candidatus Bathyarchaeota archaeon]